MENFRQMQIETVQAEYTVLVSKKGKISIKRKNRKSAAPPAELSHDRKKRYILEEGTFVPFLNDLGVMTEEGKIVRTKTDKFRLKEDVIRRCSGLAKKYGYEKLHFLVGDIADYEGVNEVDVVVTLHACDTATDYALAKAIGWNAKVILSVPCCQHEVNGQFAKADKTQCYDGCLDPIMDYGLLRERFAALVTDGLRAKYCERFLQIEPTLGRLLADKGENYKE